MEPISIGEETNIQDGVIIHALGGTGVSIGPGSSVAHGAIIHGPCQIGANCFVGFNTVVYNATLGEGVVIMHQALVEEVSVPDGLYVPSMTAVRSEAEVGALTEAGPDVRAFVERVRLMNLRLVEAKR